MNRILIIVLSLLTSPVVMGQSKEKQEKTVQQPEQTEQDYEGETEKQPAADVSDTFTPTEEISEDLSVSFPVDI